MTSNEFEIDPTVARRNRRTTQRPLPPGQNRHRYDDQPESPRPTADNDDDEEFDNEDSEETVQLEASRRRKTNKGTSAAKRSRHYSRAIDNEPPWLVRFFFDRRVAVFAGLTCIMVGVAIFVVLLSHLKTGALDQALITNMTPQQIAEAGLEVKSGVGPLGAWFGEVLFAKSFGVGAFVIAAYFCILGWNLTMGRKFEFWSLTFKSTLLTVTLSILVGLLTFAMSGTTFWGGVHGHYINQWLLSMTGIPGALFVSGLLVAAVVSVYLNDLIRYWKNVRQRIARRKALLAEQQVNRRLAKAREREARIATRQDAVAKVAVPDVTPAAPDTQTTPDIDSAPDTHTPQPSTDLGLGAAIVAGINASAATGPANTVFEIDTPVDDTPATTADADQKDADAPATLPDGNDGPGFEIDVPVVEVGKTTGTVAERLVAEQGEYDPRADLAAYKFPTLDLLEDRPLRETVDSEEQEANKQRIIKTLGDYKITVASIKATVGPTVTLYEIVPTEGIRIAQIKRLEDDIAMSLAAKGIRIIAPMPGKGTVGIEVPNREPQVVSMRTILASKKFRESKAALPVALGATISNDIFVADLAGMPHALVAGATGQGKSVGLNVLITSLLYRKHPSELKFVLIDPKMVEFSVYERLKYHYLAALPDEEDAIVTDPSKVLNVLNSLCVEMDNRYALLRNAAVNKIEDYNRKFKQRRLNPEKGHKYLPYIVVIIDEFADLIMTGGKEIEMPVMRITQKARAVGIHMIIATQRPSTNVLTGLIKANCPTRIAFRVLQNVDSRTILDRPNAERLIGRGDMLYSQGGDMERMQCAFISSDEVEAICDNIDAQPGFERPYDLPEPMANEGGMGGFGGGMAGGGMDRDPLFDDAARFIVQSSTASTSSLQRRFEIGYNRAGKIMDQMEASGIVGPASGSKPRSVLVDPTQLERILANR